MEKTLRDKILSEDFERLEWQHEGFDYWKHKKYDVYAFLSSEEEYERSIIFVRAKDMAEFKRGISGGVKFNYSTVDELARLIVAISEKQ